MNHDLFSPPPVIVPPAELDWMQPYLSRLGRTYRWALMPGTPTDGELPPEGFVLEYAVPVEPIQVVDEVTQMIAHHTPAVSWHPVRFAPRREEIWAELRKAESMTAASETTGHTPGSEDA